MTRLLILNFLLAAMCIQPALGQDANSPSTEFVFEIRADLEPAVVLGDSSDGQRQAIPIIGGVFAGPNIKGEVLAGGADYQLTRPDGVRELTAIYMIRTDDGALINVINEGIVVAPEAPDGEAYVVTTPKFRAPVGKYDWLNKSIFVSRIVGSRDDPPAVFIRVYRVL